MEPPDGDLGDEFLPGAALPGEAPPGEASFDDEPLPPEPFSVEAEPESPEPFDDDPDSLALLPDFSTVVVVVPASPEEAAARLSLR